MTPNVAVRPAVGTDAPDIQRVARASWHAAHDDIVGEETVESMLARHYAVSDLQESIADDESVFFVAADDEVVGFANAGPGGEGDAWSLYRIYVHPDRWDEGIGTRLVERVEGALDERGVEALRLVVMADNDVGVNFYESADYEHVDDHWNDDLEVLGYVYEKAL